MYPSLYQVNTRVLLTGLSVALNRKATLSDIPDSELDRWASLGFDWIWMLSVWQTGFEGQQVSRTHPEWQQEFRHTLPDLRADDIAGSGFAIAAYRVSQTMGGNEALARLRERLKERGLKLMLDFVPNHMARDHEWLTAHPEFFVQGTEADLNQAPGNFFRAKVSGGDLIMAHGRDPYFPGWPDTLQLNYANPGLQQAMKEELVRIAGQCDGVRCDMAMLILPEVFERTWGVRPEPFWPAAIETVRNLHAEFTFMAEVYWDLEWNLQQQGFDYTYDKRLYDRLLEGNARPVREHFLASMDYQRRMARFMENHDEPRAAMAFAPAMHQAAAILTYFSPGLRFFHQGQLEGCQKRISPHLVRAPKEPVNQTLFEFYTRLLSLLKRKGFQEGTWSLLNCREAWHENHSNESFIGFAWKGGNEVQYAAMVNYSPNQGQCYVTLPFSGLPAQTRLVDLFTGTTFDRNGNELTSSGLFLDEPGWKYYLFELK